MQSHENISTFMTRLYSSVEEGILAFVFVLVTLMCPVVSTADCICELVEACLLTISSNGAAVGSLHSVSSALIDR